MAASLSSTAPSRKTILCKWMDCTLPGPYGTVQELADHVRTQHVENFNSQDIVLCLWEGCKVYNVPCQKKSWLPQHMRRHTNERPYKCIMNGCNQSFWSTQALNNHLQLHLLPSPLKAKKTSKRLLTSPSNEVNDQEAPPLKKSCATADGVSDNESTLSESIKRKSNLKTFSFSASPSPVPMNGGLLHDDLMDSKVMSVISQAVVAQHLRSNSVANNDREVIALTGEIVGKRTTADQKEEEYLIRWSPRILPDNWICKSEYTGTRYVLVSELLHCQRAALVQCSYFTKSIQEITKCSQKITKRQRKRASQ